MALEGFSILKKGQHWSNAWFFCNCLSEYCFCFNIVFHFKIWAWLISEALFCKSVTFQLFFLWKFVHNSTLKHSPVGLSRFNSWSTNTSIISPKLQMFSLALSVHSLSKASLSSKSFVSIELKFELFSLFDWNSRLIALLRVVLRSSNA